MVPKCHPNSGASFTTSNDQIYISFSLDRQLLQNFTSGDENSSHLELLLMNKVLTQCLGSLTMAFMSPEGKRSPHGKFNSNHLNIPSPSRSAKRRKISKDSLSGRSSDTNRSRCDSDDESDPGETFEDAEVQKENKINHTSQPTRERERVPNLINSQPNIPTKLLGITSVQHVVSDIAAAAARETNNNSPLNLSSHTQFMLKNLELSSTGSFQNLIAPPGSPELKATPTTCDSETEAADSHKSSESDGDDSLSPECLNEEMGLVMDPLNESSSLLSPSMLQNKVPETQKLTKTNLNSENNELDGTAVVTPAAAPCGPVSNLELRDDECTNFQMGAAQGLDEMFLESMLNNNNYSTAANFSKHAKTNSNNTTANGSGPKSRDQKQSSVNHSTENTNNSSRGANSGRNSSKGSSSSSQIDPAALGFLNAAQLLSSTAFLPHINNNNNTISSISNGKVSAAAAVPNLVINKSSDVKNGAIVSKGLAGVTGLTSSQNHQLSSLIASLSNSTAVSSSCSVLNVNNNLVFTPISTKVKAASTNSNTHNNTNEVPITTALTNCTSTNQSPTSVNSSSSGSSSLQQSQSTPRRGQKSLICEFGCGYETPDATLLKSHHVSHSNDRPYQCSYCGHAFKRNHTLLRHIRQVHKIDTTSANGDPVMTVASMVPSQTAITAASSSSTMSADHIKSCSVPSLVTSTAPAHNGTTEMPSLIKMKQENSLLLKTVAKNGASLSFNYESDGKSEEGLTEDELDYEHGRCTSDSFMEDVDQKPMDLALVSCSSSLLPPPPLLDCSNFPSAAAAIKLSSSPAASSTLIDFTGSAKQPPQLTSYQSPNTNNRATSNVLNMSLKHHPTVKAPTCTPGALSSLNLVMSM